MVLTDAPLSRAISLTPLLVVASLMTAAARTAGVTVMDEGNSSLVESVASRLGRRGGEVRLGKTAPAYFP